MITKYFIHLLIQSKILNNYNLKLYYLFYNMYLFRAKTKEAFVFKVLGELLSSTLKFAPFRITENGIYLRQTDIKREQLIDLYFNIIIE